MKAESMFDELARSLELAEQDLQQATAKLERMEREIGSDLGELRALNDSTAGDSTLLITLNQIGNELRQAQTDRDANEQLLSLLQSAQVNPDRLLAAPVRLFDSQPGLKRLREGLVESQLRMAELAGTMSDQHPRVLAAREAEREVRADLHAELAVALRGLEAERNLSATRMERLREQKSEIEQRLNELAGLRARYQNLVKDVSQRGRIVDKCQQDLADARASAASAESTSLISRLDRPLASTRPLGPSNAAILAAGTVGGLISGFGLVFLLTPFPGNRQRRWSDCLPFGRRAADRHPAPADELGTPRRRATDRQVAGEQIKYGRRATDLPQRAVAAEPDAELAEQAGLEESENLTSVLRCLEILEKRRSDTEA